MRILTGLMTLMFFFGFESFSQEKLWNLELGDRENTLVLSESVTDAQLLSLAGDSLAFRAGGVVRWIPVDSLLEMDRRVSRSHMFEGFLMGGAIGGGLGFIIEKTVRTNSNSQSIGFQGSGESSDNSLAYTLAGVAVGGSVGGILGAKSGKESHDLREMGKMERLAFLKKELEGPPAAGNLHQVVRLRNGSRIKGNITESIPDSIVKIRTADSSLFVFRAAEVEGISSDSSSILAAPAPAPLKEERRDVVPVIENPRRRPAVTFFAGVAIPVGEFGKTNTETAGGAKTGFSLGGDLSIPLDNALSVLVSVTVSSNEVDMSSIEQYGLQVEIGSWLNIWPMVGIRAVRETSAGVALQTFAQLGVVAGNSPELTVMSGSQRLTQASASASALAFSLGAGLIFNGKFTIGVRWMTGEPEYSLTTRSSVTSVQSSYSQPTSIVHITAGFVF